MVSDKLKIPGVQAAVDVWKNIQEVDLRPVREEAERNVRIAIVGKAGTGKQALAAQMRYDPALPEQRTHTPVWLLEPGDAGDDLDADLIILLVDLFDQKYAREAELLRQWQQLGKQVLTIFVLSADENIDMAEEKLAKLTSGNVLAGCIGNPEFIKQHFVPSVISLLAEDLLSLGRQFPLFRLPIARKLINDVSFSNAMYAFSTGIGEIVPVLDIPLNVADVVVLTKAQAFLVYKLGLLFGYSVHWRDYLAEFSGILGGGFLWRQIARQLIGLIPVWGIVPKTAVAYAGTYAVGEAVLAWYITGRQVTKEQLRRLYRKAFASGKNLAKSLASKAAPSRLKLFKRKTKNALSAGGKTNNKPCPACGKNNQPDARFCQYCGRVLE